MGDFISEFPDLAYGFSNSKVCGKHVIYLTDEGHSPGKGANGVISYVHHNLKTYGFGEKSAVLNFDNCGGQNKNNPVLCINDTEPGIEHCQTHTDGDMQRFSLLQVGVNMQDRVVEHRSEVKGLDIGSDILPLVLEVLNSKS